mmetsp:Transcript_134423/g.233654  ORF Transcript_134423/g.233654 Transcript_134423/m.233654 type:complete len:225 (-) Transcript_134423:106-780(-)
MWQQVFHVSCFIVELQSLVDVAHLTMDVAKQMQSIGTLAIFGQSGFQLALSICQTPFEQPDSANVLQSLRELAVILQLLCKLLCFGVMAGGGSVHACVTLTVTCRDAKGDVVLLLGRCRGRSSHLLAWHPVARTRITNRLPELCAANQRSSEITLCVGSQISTNLRSVIIAWLLLGSKLHAFSNSFLQSTLQCCFNWGAGQCTPKQQRQCKVHYVLHNSGENVV